jgi:hypothetical protein
MDYQSILHFHTIVGVLTLIMFWTAAFSVKGGKTHRLAGKIYLVCIVLILASVIPITILTLERKGYAAAFGLAFLFVMTFTAAWVARRSIACKNELSAYRNYMLKGLASLLTAFGIFLLLLSIRGGSFLYSFFACTGITLAGSMWHLIMARDVKPNWYLVQHLNGVALLFAATHASFLRFGLTKLIPVIPDTPEFNTVAQTSVILFALLLRLTIGSHFITRRTNYRSTTA